MKNTNAQNLKNIKTLTKPFFVLSLIIFVVSAGLRVYFCNTLAVKNSDLRQAFDKKASLEKEVSLLKFEDSNLSAMNLVEQKATGLGFVKMEDRLLSLDPIAPVQVALSN